MHELADEKGVNHRDRSRFGRREGPAVDAAKDQHGRADRPFAVPAGPADARPCETVIGLPAIAAPARDQPCDHQKQCARDQPRQDAGKEHARDRGVRNHAVDDHQVARRNEASQRAAGGDDGAAIGRVVALADHRRNHDGADCRRRRGTRARKGGEERASEHGHQAETAHVVADQRLGDRHDPQREAAAFHERAGEHEQGHGQERKRLDPGVHGLGQRHGRNVDQEVADQRRDRHRDRDRDTEGDGDDQRPEHVERFNHEEPLRPRGPPSAGCRPGPNGNRPG